MSFRDKISLRKIELSNDDIWIRFRLMMPGLKSVDICHEEFDVPGKKVGLC